VERRGGEINKEETLHVCRGAMKWSLQVAGVYCKYG
jgi:hypothetical protein